MARKKIGSKKVITAKQKSARRKNIAVARKMRKKAAVRHGLTKLISKFETSKDPMRRRATGQPGFDMRTKKGRKVQGAYNTLLKKYHSLE